LKATKKKKKQKKKQKEQIYTRHMKLLTLCWSMKTNWIADQQTKVIRMRWGRQGEKRRTYGSIGKYCWYCLRQWIFRSIWDCVNWTDMVDSY
jgi:DNA-directed RNA polymerase sigma subunit (sigma70/sigma32)